MEITPSAVCNHHQVWVVVTKITVAHSSVLSLLCREYATSLPLLLPSSWYGIWIPWLEHWEPWGVRRLLYVWRAVLMLNLSLLPLLSTPALCPDTARYTFLIKKDTRYTVIGEHTTESYSHIKVNENSSKWTGKMVGSSWVRLVLLCAHMA
jgi:hypothetical protein